MNTPEEISKILLVEDDPNLGTFLHSYLITKGYPTTLCTDGNTALETFRENTFNLCITDIMIPGRDGFELAQEIRKLNPKMPIVFLTAKSMEIDRVKGFQLGADDYIPKPFNMDELLLRLQAILRRSRLNDSEPDTPVVFDLGKAQFNYQKQCLSLANDQRIALTTKENELLLILCQKMNQVIERTDILKRVWHSDNYFNARSMDVYLAKLRKILKKNSDAEILNVHGVGFKLSMEQEA